MDFSLVNIPQISISPAPLDEPSAEPYSPFLPTAYSVDDDESFRPRLLTPPPTHTGFARQLSPLRPPESSSLGKGLERDRFEALLQASKQRNPLVGAKKPCNLRKEIALKVHQNKQMERRALFLSKVMAPPSPSATSTPKTPPDSPAIFHYSLPSPGLVSPLALFESLTENAVHEGSVYSPESWIEQVDFRLPEKQPKSKQPALDIFRSRPTKASGGLGKTFPSLDQISARLNSQRYDRVPGDTISRPGRLPAFLAPSHNTTASAKPAGIELARAFPPKSPLSLLPEIHVTTLKVPRTTPTPTTELSESNLLALDSRERRVNDMLSTLRRRTTSLARGSQKDNEDSMNRSTKWKRHSAPADFSPSRGRAGFEHPVLAVPGGF